MAFHTLRMVTLATKHLERLGLGNLQIQQSVLHRLHFWEAALVALCVLSSALGFMYISRTACSEHGPRSHLLNLSLSGECLDNPVLAVAELVWLTVFLPAVFIWWFSLRVACAFAIALLESTHRKVRDLVQHVDAENRALNADSWKAMELAVLRLGRHTLPTLSAGWGPSAVTTVLGLVASAFSWYIRQLEGKVFKLHGGDTWYSGLPQIG